MVMSQSAIDALMSANQDEAEVEEDDGLDAGLDQAAAAEGVDMAATTDAEEAAKPKAEDEALDLGALTEEERAIVEAVAEETSGSDPQLAEVESAAPAPEAADEASPKVRTWSASATTQTDQIENRLKDIEDTLAILEASGPSASATDSAEVDGVKAAVDQINSTVQSLWSMVQALTEQSQASLGFNAKQTFDCPECGSHGTVSVPISCTNCGHETEWGFRAEQQPAES